RRILAGEGVLQYERRANNQELVYLRDHHLRRRSGVDIGPCVSALAESGREINLLSRDDAEKQEIDPLCSQSAPAGREFRRFSRRSRCVRYGAWGRTQD